MSERFEIVFAGTGSPLGNPDRCGAGQVLVAGETHVMVDCGWGTARKLQPAGVRPNLIDIALFTHMHSDHITDVPDFLFLRWTGGATTPLRVYGPIGTKETMEGFAQALRLDIGYRLAHHGDALHPDGIKLVVTELAETPEPKEFLDAGGMKLESFDVDHFPVKPAFGYRATFDGRAVVLSGDTALCDTLTNASRGVDMLVCEAMNAPMWEQRRAAVQGMGMAREAKLLGDVPSYHISTMEIAGVARDANVGEVVLTHILPAIAANDEQEAAFIAGMSETYSGPVRVARDATRIAITKRS